MKAAIVSSKELGTNCWSSYRFCYGMRCAKVLTCTYPEKATCQAVQREKDFIEQNRTARITQIEASAKKALEQLEQQSSRKMEKLNGNDERIPL
jgi:hypothetical protein